MQVTPAYLSSVATFYDMLRTEPAGEPLRVRVHERGLPRAQRAPRLRGARRGGGRAGRADDLDLREFECLGACDMAPMASFDGRYVGPLSVEDAPEVIRQLKAGETVMPGRGLEDPGYGVPIPAPQPEGEPEQPKVEPAGGAWPETADVDPPPAEGPPPHRRRARPSRSRPARATPARR